MLPRPILVERVKAALRRSRAVALFGPRQSGKSTLARLVAGRAPAAYFDLEDPESLARLAEPMTALRPLRGLVVIDEIQRRPELFPVLRVLCDRRPLPARFLLLGSASMSLAREVSESLTGRLETVDIGGFTLGEVGLSRHGRHWLRGGLPPSFLAKSDEASAAWRKGYIRSVLERDVPQLGIRVPATALYRFWSMLAHYHAQVWSAAEPARSLGAGETTVRRYLDILDGLFMVRQLQPWHENLGKRQVKAPKVYFRDTGLLHQLLGVRTGRELLGHPKCGASWEGYVVAEALEALRPDEAYFWSTHNGAELDLLLFRRGKRIGIEVKRADAPRLTPSMRIAMRDLRLDRLFVVYPGERGYTLAPRVEVLPLAALTPDLL
ncbi:MAG: ATP-binding protein [Elusimicrobia bacterium]|nr:ATP-binding protein [Elusimicrobiota bacterium]